LASILLNSEDKSKGCEHQSEDDMSDVLKTVSETVNDLHQSGAVDETTLNQFEEVCSIRPDDVEETKIQNAKETP
jgi:putative transcriptional regulator